MASSWALLAVVLAIAFVVLFDRVHARNRNYRRLWKMYRELRGRNRQV